jgi:hypothetical protein
MNTFAKLVSRRAAPRSPVRPARNIFRASRAASLLGSLLVTVSALAAQTTGVVGVNDLSMMLPPSYTSVGSGTVSCSTFVTTGAIGPNPVTFQVTSSTATAAFLLVSPLGCVPAFFPFLPSATPACAGPLAGTPFTNRWLSLVVGGPFPLVIPSVPGTIGYWNFNLTWPIAPIYVQALLMDPCAPGGFKFSQAMGFQ